MIHFSNPHPKECIMKSGWLFLALAISACPPSSTLVAQERPQRAEGQIQLGLHKYRMQAGSIYEFEVAGEGFNPEVRLSGNGILHPSFHRDLGPNGFHTFFGVFIPEDNAERTLIVSPRFLVGSVPEGGRLKYTVTMKAMKLDERPLLTKDDKITADDPVHVDKGVNRGTHFKSYDLKLKAEQICVIEMTPKKAPGKGGRLYPRLLVEANAKQLAQRSGGNQSAVLIFRAPADGDYRILATGLTKNLDLGDFTLSVRTIKREK